MIHLLWLLLLLLIPVWRYATRVKRQRVKLLGQKLTKEDWQHLEKHAVIVTRIPKELRPSLEGIVNVLLQEKSFEPCGGLAEVTREMKVVTAAQAALLLVGREHDFFPRLRSILLYPGAFKGGRDDETTRLGESWGSGSVILSWRSVCKGGEDPKDGHNVVIHEFAHQLDQETGWGDGVPYLTERGDYVIWAKAFKTAYEDFCDEVNAGVKTVLDDYGATNPAEFFSVASETFFEKADQLKEARPNIYEQLVKYYGLDPANWR